MSRTSMALLAGLLLVIGPPHTSAAAQPSATSFSLADRQALLDAARTLTAQRLPDVQRAAENGDVAAQVVLAIAYEQGRIVAKDPAQAVAWLEKAATSRHPMALCSLAMHYLSREQGPGDDASAAELLQAAADQGFAVAQNNLGVLYARGRGVPKDLTRSASWYRKAAEQGYAQAAINLAAVYDNGWGVKVDHVEAGRWWRVAADAGDAEGQFNLAMAYYLGEGVPKSKDECEAWLTKASYEGHAAASFYKGKLHAGYSFVGGPFAQAVADDYFQRSATQGYALGALMMGIRARDHTDAYKWYLVAAALEQRADWRERWAQDRPADAEQLRRELPKRLDSTRRKLSPDQIGAAERRASEFVGIHRGLTES